MFRAAYQPRRPLVVPARTRELLAISKIPNKDLATRFNQWLVCQRYSARTRSNYRTISEMFLAFWGQRPLFKVNPVDIQNFLIEVSRRDLSADVVHRYIWALRSFFDYLCMSEVVRDIAPRLLFIRPAKRSMPKALSEDNIRRLIKAAKNARDRAMIEMYYATGCRSSELLKARLEDVDFKNRTIRVEAKGSERRVMFGRGAERALKIYLAGRNSGYLFESQHPIQEGCIHRYKYSWQGFWLDYSDCGWKRRLRSISLGPRSQTRAQAWVRFRKLVPNPDEGHHRHKPQQLTRSGLAQILSTLGFNAGLGRVTANMLRHSFATHMMDHGADVRLVRELLGHSSVATTHVYCYVSGASVARGYRLAHPRA